uniref:Uncharacterized protein n=1 Tax=Arundo donax TaxID=35708 RepID=A0A0A9E175_ARUDO
MRICFPFSRMHFILVSTNMACSRSFLMVHFELKRWPVLLIVVHIEWEISKVL